MTGCICMILLHDSTCQADTFTLIMVLKVCQWKIGYKTPWLIKWDTMHIFVSTISCLEYTLKKLLYAGPPPTIEHPCSILLSQLTCLDNVQDADGNWLRLGRYHYVTLKTDWEVSTQLIISPVRGSWNFGVTWGHGCCHSSGFADLSWETQTTGWILNEVGSLTFRSIVNGPT
jgi:hypothetical protein